MSQPNEKNKFLPGWGDRLTRARKFIKKSQADVGAALGVRNTAVSKWESEQTEFIDERSLTTLEFVLGIRRGWVVEGQEPMIAETWNRETMRGLLDQAAGSRIDGVFVVPPGAGMAPWVAAGEIVMWTRCDHVEAGSLYLAANPKAQPAEPGLAPEGSQIGQAFPSLDGSWLLYRPEDRTSPGHFPPIPLRNLAIFGRVIARVSPIHDGTDLALKA